jgi:DNA invertase Pin-like site-specific DNA recombinase
MYIRLSLEDVKTDSLSIPNQRLLLGRHIDTLEQSDIEVLEFIDNGHSGVNFERPAVQELLELVRQSKIDCIIVKDFSRFGRNSIETSYFIEQVFPVFGTRFISVSDSFDTQDHKGDTGGLQVAFKYLMHEYYSQDLSRKTKSSKYNKMKRGEYQSKVCLYGYQKGANGRMEIDENTADVIRFIFNLALETKNAAGIVQALFERKIPTPGEYRAAMGKAHHDISRCRGIWDRTMILRILGDERYIGTYIMGKRTLKEIGGKRSRLKDESEWYKIPEHHPAIISKELYEQVQAKLLHFKCDKHKRHYNLRTKVICGCCGHAMVKYKKINSVFLCRYTKVDVNAECHGLQIGEQELEDMLFEIISKQAQVVLNVDLAGGADDLDLLTEQEAGYKRQLEDCQNRKRGVYERYILREIDAVKYKNLKIDIDAECKRLESAFKVLSERVSQTRLNRETDTKTRAIAENVSRESGLTESLVNLLIEKVLVYPDNQIEIVWKASGLFNSDVKGAAKIEK